MKTSFSGTYANISGLWLTSGASNILWTEESEAGGTNAIWKYEDALTIAPTLVGPEDGASTGRTTYATVSWEELTGATTYIIWCAGEDTFATLAGGTGRVTSTSSTTSKKLTPLTAGKTYYWKVRSADSVATYGAVTGYAGRALSPWSEIRSFTVGIAGGEWNPFRTAEGFAGNVAPIPGATDIPLKPSFQWNAADWATAYEFVLADNPDFASPIVSKTGASALATTAFALDTDLDYSTSYYWKVRATSATSQSVWGVGVFTTLAKPVAPTPPVEITPAPPAPVLPTPTTPVYVWAIIGIGALLVIALIVLIVRTRRVA